MQKMGLNILELQCLKSSLILFILQIKNVKMQYLNFINRLKTEKNRLTHQHQKIKK